MAGIGIENLVSLNTLVFSSTEFLFRYLPVFLLIFFLVPNRFRNFVLFAYSILLYGAGEPLYVCLLLGMTVVNWLFGRSLQGEKAVSDYMQDKWRHRRKKKWFVVAVLCNVLLLVYFKISNAFDSGLLLPIGISFYTFKSISYLADVYLEKVEAEQSFVSFGAYLCMFPQIVSGPIMRYEEAALDLKFGVYSLAQAENGLRRIVIGLGAKVLIADRLGILWNDIQTIGFESISTPLAWLGALGYSLQLYFDFAGYSLIAVGIGEIIGLPVIKNFDQPYSSRSISEFYRRWHITLGSWFRDYIYIPMGGNRKGLLRTVINLLVVWTLTGFWHGGSINFVIWGLILGILIVAEKLIWGRFLKKHRIFSHIYVLFLIPLTWMVFAIPSLSDMGIYFARLFPFFGIGTAVNPGDFIKELTIFATVLVPALLFCIPAVCTWFEKHKRSLPVLLATAAMFWLTVYQMANAVNNPFMYANF